MPEIEPGSENVAQTDRKLYHRPELVEYGTVADLVQASPSGTVADNVGTITFFITT